MKAGRGLFHILVVIGLTLLTQVGGLLWLLNLLTFRLVGRPKSSWTKLMSFILLYLFSTFIVVPRLAEIGGRTPLPMTKSGHLVPHTLFTAILNRHYVKPTLKDELLRIANKINSDNHLLKLSYLDANFPFIDGFPLLPHLSHNDGRKVDLSFYYTHDSEVSNLKPSFSGYGHFVEPVEGEFHQARHCASKGYGQYDYPKYLTLGSRKDLDFDEHNTRKLVTFLVQSLLIEKVFVEPHLKTRMNLNSSKIRFQGCHSVRHDDHIHVQIAG